MTGYPPDQSGYLVGGKTLIAAIPGILQGNWTDSKVEAARRWFDFLGVAFFYGLADALRPGDIDFFRRVLGLLNALTAFASCRLAAQLGGHPASMVTAFFFLLSPAFAAGASRVYPDALTGALLCGGLSLLLGAETRLTAFVAGGLLGASLLIRVQLVPWIPGLLLLCLVAGSPWWMGDPRRRLKVLSSSFGFLIPCLVLASASALALENNDYRAPKHNLPRYQAYAMGVWQYLDTDGWDGPYRLKKEPFYLALVEASRADPELMRSRIRQYGFALHYLWLRRAEAAPLILDNFVRIVGRPQNPEHRSFFGNAELLVGLHRVAILGAVAGGALCFLRGGFFILVPLLPLFVASVHAFAFPWPRYFMPVLPVAFALSGVGIAAMGRGLPERSRGALWSLVFLAALGFLRFLLADPAPEAARAVSLLALAWGLISLALLAAPPGSKSRDRQALLAAFGAVAVAALNHEWRSRSWHETVLALQDGDTLRQEIALDARSVERLRALPERFLAVDAELAGLAGDPWELFINGRPSLLQPSIPPMPESIPFAEEARSYPQWWIAPLSSELLDQVASEGCLRAEIKIRSAGDVKIRADRFEGQASVLEAPSFGEWPKAVGLKPEYDRDFRLVSRYHIESGATQTTLVRGSQTRVLRAIARIRVLGLQDRTGRVVFDAAPSRISAKGGPAVLGFSARSGMRGRGEAELLVNGRRLIRFPIGHFSSYERTSGAWRLCYRDLTPNNPEAFEARGHYYLRGPLGCVTERCRVAVEFLPGLDDRPLFFTTEPAPRQPAEEAHHAPLTACGFGVADPDWVFGRLVDGTSNRYPEDRGRWAVSVVF
jgi:hypothetical protein